MDRLAILAAKRFRASVVVRPFVPDHHHRMAIAHFAVGEIAIGIEQHEQRFEPERVLEPAEGGLAVLIADRARKPLGAVLLGHFVSPANHMISYLRSEEHTSELQSLMRISYAVFCLKKKS